VVAQVEELYGADRNDRIPKDSMLLSIYTEDEAGEVQAGFP